MFPLVSESLLRSNGTSFGRHVVFHGVEDVWLTLTKVLGVAVRPHSACPSSVVAWRSTQEQAFIYTATVLSAPHPARYREAPSTHKLSPIVRARRGPARSRQWSH